MNKHAYLPMIIVFDRVTVCMSQVFKEVAEVQRKTLQHATAKHGQTIGMLERTHASLKKTLGIETCERRYLWHSMSRLQF